jgi:hypothetical protein
MLPTLFTRTLYLAPPCQAMNLKVGAEQSMALTL